MVVSCLLSRHSERSEESSYFLIYVIETLLDWAKELSSGHVPQNDSLFSSCPSTKSAL